MSLMLTISPSPTHAPLGWDIYVHLGCMLCPTLVSMLVLSEPSALFYSFFFWCSCTLFTGSIIGGKHMHSTHCESFTSLWQHWGSRCFFSASAIPLDPLLLFSLMLQFPKMSMLVMPTVVFLGKLGCTLSPTSIWIWFEFKSMGYKLQKPCVKFLIHVLHS